MTNNNIRVSVKKPQTKNIKVLVKKEDDTEERKNVSNEIEAPEKEKSNSNERMKIKIQSFCLAIGIMFGFFVFLAALASNL